eukprot:GHVS01016238.1.p1 GENE.GHVS01016238.1~~GHVS01016238.1.p1  ORF type:complete len:257 (+),score=82.92 GHVS01016238.1:59-829(+)
MWWCLASSVCDLTMCRATVGGIRGIRRIGGIGGSAVCVVSAVSAVIGGGGVGGVGGGGVDVGVGCGGGVGGGVEEPSGVHGSIRGGAAVGSLLGVSSGVSAAPRRGMLAADETTADLWGVPQIHHAGKRELLSLSVFGSEANFNEAYRLLNLNLVALCERQACQSPQRIGTLALLNDLLASDNLGCVAPPARVVTAEPLESGQMTISASCYEESPDGEWMVVELADSPCSSEAPSDAERVAPPNRRSQHTQQQPFE